MAAQVKIYGERGQKVEPCMSLALVMSDKNRDRLMKGVKWLKTRTGGKWVGGNFLTMNFASDDWHYAAGGIRLWEAERILPDVGIGNLIKRGMGIAILCPIPQISRDTPHWRPLTDGGEYAMGEVDGVEGWRDAS